MNAKLNSTFIIQHSKLGPTGFDSKRIRWVSM